MDPSNSALLLGKLELILLRLISLNQLTSVLGALRYTRILEAFQNQRLARKSMFHQPSLFTKYHQRMVKQLRKKRRSLNQFYRVAMKVETPRELSTFTTTMRLMNGFSKCHTSLNMVTMMMMKNLSLNQYHPNKSQRKKHQLFPNKPCKCKNKNSKSTVHLMEGTVARLIKLILVDKSK